MGPSLLLWVLTGYGVMLAVWRLARPTCSAAARCSATLPCGRAAANMVFQLVNRRYERVPIILTSNKAFSEWGQVFTDEVLATAILDRLLHYCDVVAINGPSYRLKDRTLAPAGAAMP